jgi:hypothetical protein
MGSPTPITVGDLSSRLPALLTRSSPQLPNHELTHEERSRGGKARAEKIRSQREEAQQLAHDRVSGLVSAALDRVEATLASESDVAALRTAREILDRGLGKPPQALERGMSLSSQRAVEEARAAWRAEMATVLPLPFRGELATC